MDTNITSSASIGAMDAAQTGDAPDSSTATRLAIAQQAHAAAVENHRQLQETAARAGTAHRAAIAHRQGLLDRASGGEDVDATDLKRAGVDIAEARDQDDLRRAIAAGAVPAVEKAEYAVLEAEAAILREKCAATVGARLDAAEQVDEVGRQYVAAIEAFNATGLDVSIARAAASQHDSKLDGIATRNAYLANQQRFGIWPSTNAPAAPAMRAIEPPRLVLDP